MAKFYWEDKRTGGFLCVHVTLRKQKDSESETDIFSKLLLFELRQIP